jgi:acyl carrier protein
MPADLNQLNAIFCEVFDNSAIKLTRETAAKDVPEWDSLMHIQLVVAVEKHFKVRFAPGEIERLNNVGEFLDLISRKTGA